MKKKENSIFTKNPLDKSYFNLKSKVKCENKYSEIQSDKSDYSYSTIFRIKNKKLSSPNNYFDDDNNENIEANFNESPNLNIINEDYIQKIKSENEKLKYVQSKNSKNCFFSFNNIKYQKSNGKNIIDSTAIKHTATFKSFKELLNKEKYILRFLQRAKATLITIDSDKIDSPVRFK